MLETFLWCMLIVFVIVVGGTILVAAVEWKADRTEAMTLNDIFGPEENER